MIKTKPLRSALPVIVLGMLTATPGGMQGTVGDIAVRAADISVDGGLVAEIDGDLWAASGEDWQRRGLAALERVTAGPARDYQPRWSADGQSIIFSSNRDGRRDLWELPIASGDGPRRLTDAPEGAAEPAPGPNGQLIFVRGDDSERRLWLRTPGGEERVLTDSSDTESSPSWSPDGRWVAYVADADGQRQLRLWSPEDSTSSILLRDQSFEAPSWSPDSTRLTYSTRRGKTGVWVTDVEGSFHNLVASERAAAVWSSDGESLLMVEMAAPPVSYNGDPRRLGGRDPAAIPQETPLRVWTVPAPPVPAIATVVKSVPVVDPLSARRLVFDETWQRMADLYLQQEDRDFWNQVREEFLPRVQQANTPRAIDEMLYEMLERRPAARPEARGSAAVSSAHPLATAAGIEVLERGGNVVDAAVAISFALGVVEPDASGVGGYGEMLVFVEGMQEPVAIEFLTRVPGQASLDNGARLPRDGPTVVNVPGTVAGMWTAWQRYGSGSVAWKDLVLPAVRLAEDGFVLDESFPTTLKVERRSFLKYPSSAALFFPGEIALQPGDLFRNPDLAWTLRQVAEGGAQAFYEGEVADRIVRDLRGQGSPLSQLDLKRYYAAVRPPISTTYRGHTIFSSVPAASGGAVLSAKLKLLERYRPLKHYTRDPLSLHAMIEAWKLTPSTRDRIADPGLWPVDTSQFTDAERAARVWSRCFDSNQALTPERLRQGSDHLLACEQQEAASLSWGASLECREASPGLPCRSTGTTAFGVADASGNLVAVTQTLGTWGGNFYVTPGLGFLYNDKLRSYGTAPDRFGARLPYARNGTNIAPTLLFKGTGPEKKPLAALGAAGNAWITSAVYQMIVGLIDFELGPQEALELPRFLVVRGNENRPPGVQVEAGLSPSVVRRLTELGHRLQFISLPGELRMGYGAAVVIDGNHVRAAADPRRSGAAGAIQE